MIIDGHAHMCGTYLTIEGIQNELKKCHADKVILTPGELHSKRTYALKDKTLKNPLADVVTVNNKLTKVMISLIGAKRHITEGNELVYALAKRAPQMVLHSYWVTKDNYQMVATCYDRMHFCDIKFHECWEKLSIEDAWFQETAKWATDMHLPIFIHLYSYQEVYKLIQFIKNNPNATIIVAHLYGMELFLNKDIHKFSNVYFDLSNCYFVSKERMLLAYRHFGCEKLLLGSDTPYGVDSLQNTISRIDALPLLASEKEQILGNNLANLLKLQ